MKKTLAGAAAALFLAGLAVAASDKLTDARKLLDRGMNRTAEELLLPLAEKDPPDLKANLLLAEARLAIAESSISMPDAERAVSAANRATDAKDDSVEAWLFLGRACFQQGLAAIRAGDAGNSIKSYFADAEFRFRKVLALAPEHPDVRWWMGWAKEWQEYPVEARKLYDEQIAKFPKVIGGYRRLGHMISLEANALGGGSSPEAQAKRAEALKVLEDGLAQAGEDAETLYEYGIALEWASRKPDAIAAYYRAIDADPEYFKSWDRLRAIKAPAADLEAAADKCLKKDALAPTPAMWKGFYVRTTGDPAEAAPKALDVLLPALTEHGEHGGVYTQAIAAAMELLKVNVDAGVAALAKIHDLYPFSGDAANNLGLYYRDTLKYKESLDWYTKAADRSPDSQGVLNDTGLIWLFHFPGKEKESLPFFERVVWLVEEGGQAPEMGYWDCLENLCKYYWEIDKQPEKVIQYAKMRYETTKGVEPYNMSPKAQHYAELAKKALGK